MDSHTNQFVLPAVVFLWHFGVLILFLLFLLFTVVSTALVFLSCISCCVESILFAHNIIERVRLEVKMCGELKKRVDLIVSEGVEIEDNALQMYDQYIRGL